MQRLPRIVELLLVVALWAAVAWWVLQLARGTPIAVPPPSPPPLSAGSGRVDEMLESARLFGSRRPGVLSDNVRALGVVADGEGHGSVIVSVDGQPAKVYRVGDTLDGRLVAAVRSDEIELDAGGARQVFRLPPRAAATGLTVLGTGTALGPGPAPSTSPTAMAPAPLPTADGQPVVQPSSPYGPPPLDPSMQPHVRRPMMQPPTPGAPPAMER